VNQKADFLLNESIRIDSHNESNRFESRIGMLQAQASHRLNPDVHRANESVKDATKASAYTTHNTAARRALKNNVLLNKK